MVEVLGGIATALGGYEVELALATPGGECPPVVYSSGADEDQISAYVEHFHTIDPGFAQMETARVGEVVAFESFISSGELLQSEFYNDFLQPRGFSWGPNYSAVLAQEGGRLAAFLGIARKGGAARLRKEGLELLELLVPHLMMARSSWKMLQDVPDRQANLADAFDLLPVAVFIINARRDVVWASRAARQLVRDQDGLFIDRGQLQAREHKTSRTLEALIGATVTTGDGSGLSAGGTLLVPRANPRRSLEVRVAPLPRETSLQAFDLDGVAVVFAIDPHETPSGAPEVFAALYGLTPAESALATLLSHDLSLAESADQLGIARGTARHHLKALFRKTGTHRQASLVRLLSHVGVFFGTPQEKS
ncbi:MAG: helix-turn-helix transcriptional regulator [bacterium]|nr:helix-turn-helix transcriptional regulator [bacterium]